MNLRAKRKALVAELRTLSEKSVADGRDFTADETSRIGEIDTEIKALDAQIEADTKARAAIEVLVGSHATDDIDAQVVGGAKASGIQVEERSKSHAQTYGQAFVKSEAYEAFAKAHPSGVGNGSNVAIGRTHLGPAAGLGRKASLLTTDVAHIQNIRYPTIDLVDRPRLTLLDVISRGEMAGAFEYIQITGVNRNAAIVAEATGEVDDETGEDLDPLKPTSDFTTALADAKPYTYADGYDVTNQLLSDAPAFATFLDGELEYSLESVIEEKVLDGTGTGGEPRGILETTGVQQQGFYEDMVKSIRKGITRVQRVGGQTTGVLLSPEADEEWDFLQDSSGRYLGSGPFTSGPGTAWGRPRIVSELLSGRNIAILGDLSTIALLDREGLSIEAFTQHKDFAQRNKVYVRAELRAGQVIWRPNRLCVVELTNGG